MAEERFSDLGRVGAIARLYEGTPFVPFEAPVFETGGKRCVQASRVLLEGTDFDLVYFPLKHLGYKSVVAVAGEIYAQMGSPKSLEVTLGVSAKLDFEQVRQVWDGVVTAAVEHGFAHVSLDLVPSRNGLCVAVAAVGDALAVDRPAARSMDLICVSGNLGAAYFGFEVLEREKKAFVAGGDEKVQPKLDEYRHFVGAYLKPSVDGSVVGLLQEARIVPSFGYFITRGLADAVKRLVRDSGLGAKVYVDRMPFAGNSFELGKKLDIDPIMAAMNGGEDFRLLFTVPIGSHDKFRHDFQTYDIIGHLARPEVGAVLVTPDGVELPLRSQGWRE